MPKRKQSKLSTEFMGRVFASWKKMDESNHPNLDFKSCTILSVEAENRYYGPQNTAPGNRHTCYGPGGLSPELQDRRYGPLRL